MTEEMIINKEITEKINSIIRNGIEISSWPARCCIDPEFYKKHIGKKVYIRRDNTFRAVVLGKTPLIPWYVESAKIFVFRK